MGVAIRFRPWQRQAVDNLAACGKTESLAAATLGAAGPPSA
ncbi:MAG TPA: hypothetical protein VKU88_08635 [Acidimicrobiales bacterium]|nr:hypothetical protein [Acidimicrobiales bacterium]